VYRQSPRGGRLSLLSARPAITFPAEKRHRPSTSTKLYCLVKKHIGVNNLPKVITDYGALSRWELNLRPIDRKSNALPLRHRIISTDRHTNLNCIPYYSTVSLVPPTPTMNAWRGINLKGPLERKIQSTVTAADSCDGGISVLNHCLSWSKFVNTHLSHSGQWFNVQHTLNRWLYLRQTRGRAEISPCILLPTSSFHALPTVSVSRT